MDICHKQKIMLALTVNYSACQNPFTTLKMKEKRVE